MKDLILNNESTFYQITEQGEIFNKKTQKQLKGYVNNNGYVQMYLTDSQGKKKNYALHRLVALHFIPNPNNAPVVNHIDGNKQNNCVENLEWTTYSGNAQHAFDNNLSSGAYGKRNKIEININDGKWKRYLDTDYYVDKTGQCYNNKTKILLKQGLNSAGYVRYTLRINGKSCGVLAHVLVIAVWNNHILQKDEVINHKDGNHSNNDINNLEVISKQENMMHACYSLHKNVKPVCKYDKNNIFIEEYPSVSEAAKAHNRTPSAISMAIKNRGKSAGYYWKFKSEKFND